MCEMLYQTLVGGGGSLFKVKMEEELIGMIKAMDSSKHQTVYNLAYLHYTKINGDQSTNKDMESEWDMKWYDTGCVINITKLPSELKWILYKFAKIE